MADDEKDPTGESDQQNVVEKDIFVNGDADDKHEESEPDPSNSLNIPEQVLPRRSSLMNKDGAGRRPQRKKTVSFSSMPTERKIATGKY